LTVEENIINKIMTKGEILYEEPKILLKEEFKEPRVYELILRYISIGYNTYGKLENATHLDKENISKYLETLISVRLIDYILPLNQKSRGMYEIKDYFMTFYYRFVYPNLSMLEIDQRDKVMALIKTDLNIYYGHAFEKIIIEMIKTGIIELPFVPTNVKRFWKEEVEIDAIALNEDTGDICFVECKFSDNVDGLQIYHDLKYKSLSVYFRRTGEYYMIVAKSYKTLSEEAINIDFQILDKLTSKINK
jgi:AAA+ ATPase superfamily predicted ATPase